MLKERPITASDALRAASATTTRESASEQAAYLLGTIGPRYATVGLGMSDARQLKRWAAGDGAPREHAVAERLQLLTQVVHAIATIYTADVAAAFLRGANPDLDDRAPIQVIAAATTPDDTRQVLRAVRAFLEA